MAVMSTYMIERRYGPNRDWLCARSAVDCDWSLGAHKALLFASREYAEQILATVHAQARCWPNADRFTFAVIFDRKHLPSYCASVEPPKTIQLNLPSFRLQTL
jgi:hypothetical protein